MPVPTTLNDLSTTAISNSPQGTDTAKGSIDDHFRAHASLLAGLRDGDGNFTQTGTGAIARTPRSKHQEKLSVLDYIDPTLHASIQAGSYTGNLTTQITAAITEATAKSKCLFFPAGVYKCNLTVSSRFHWVGEGAIFTQLQPYSTSFPVVINLYKENTWVSATIKDIGFYNPTGFVTHAGIGFSYGDPTTYVAGQELVGRVIFTRCAFKGFNKGIAKNYGNIGNTYNQCTLQNNNYGLWAIDAQTATAGASNPMQPDTDTFNGGEIDHNAIAGVCILGYNIALGQLVFNQTIVQENEGFGIYISAPSCPVNTPEAFNQVWFEANGYPAVNVTIDYITAVGVKSTQSLMPRDAYIPDTFGYNFFSGAGGFNGINTVSPNAPLGIGANQRTVLNLIAGQFAGAKWNQIAFSDQATETTVGASIKSTTISGTNKDLLFSTGTVAYRPLYLNATGSAYIGTDAVDYATPLTGAHAIYGPGALGAGGVALTVSARFFNPIEFGLGDSTQGNAAVCCLRIPKVASTSRSINAGGTVNVNGADYAEYERNNGLAIIKGALVGFKSDGTLTKVFADSVRFGVKSTNPSLVGGDTWGEGLEGDELEAARQQVDRIAYSGKVPCNVEGATPGGYIIATPAADGSITGAFVADPTFAQYKSAVGRVNRLLPDGRCEIAVMVH